MFVEVFEVKLNGFAANFAIVSIRHNTQHWFIYLFARKWQL